MPIEETPGELPRRTGRGYTDDGVTRRLREAEAQKAGETFIPVCQRRIHMGTKQVRLDEDVYERVKDKKRPDETFSDAVDRLIGGRSLRELRDVFDEDDVSEMRDAIEEADRADRDEVREVAEQFE